MSASKKYRVLRQKLWSQPEFQDYSIEKKLLWIYLQTGTNANQLGIYQFLPRYVCLETGLSIDQIENIMNEFVEDGLVIYNRKTHEVCVLNFMVDQVAKGGTAVTQCLESDYKKVQDTSLIDAVIKHNQPLMGELPKTARDFLNSINNDTEENNKNLESISKNEELRNKNLELRINTGDNTDSVRTPVRDNTTETHLDNMDCADGNVVPTTDQIADYIMSKYYTDKQLANHTAMLFVEFNEKKNWECLKKSTWQRMLIGFLANDNKHRFDVEAVEARKAEAEKRAENERIEEERKAEEERKRQEQYDMYRHDWYPINSAQAMIDYIKQDLFFEQDYELGKCLHDMLCVSRTITEHELAQMFNESMFEQNEYGGFIELNDYGYRHSTNDRLRTIRCQISDDVYSGKYKPQTETDKPYIDTRNIYGEELPFA